ncbi:MAG: hypothetical protein D6830_07100 [Ignavibacteria bacterium]|nr:MAG: hypothetical protein D6830_07100 [Ignavibacteria bacterium]
MNKILSTIFLVMISSALFAQSKMFDGTIMPSMGINIKTYPDTTNPMNGLFVVGDKGIIELPYIGEIKVIGMSENQLKEIIQKRSRKYVKFDYLKLEVLIRIGFLGGFENPGFYYVNPHESLWEALRVTGGFLEENGFKKMKLYRGNEKIEFQAGNSISGGKSLFELGVRNGDFFTAPIPDDRNTLWQRITQTLSIVTTATAIYFTYVTLVINARRAR